MGWRLIPSRSQVSAQNTSRTTSRQLIEMPMPIGRWSQARVSAEGAGEGALVVESALEGDGTRGVIGGDEVLARGADALADEVTHGRLTEQLVKETGELPLRKMRERGEMFGFNRITKARVQMT